MTRNLVYDDDLATAKQEWMDEAMRRVAEALRYEPKSGDWYNQMAKEMLHRVADDLLSPPPPKAPSVPEVRWETVARAAAFSFEDYNDLQAFAHFMASTPGAKVVVEPRDES